MSSNLAKMAWRDPASARYAMRWLQTLRMGHGPLTDELPGITFKALGWLKGYLRPDMTVFEYGTGGSTFFFAKRVAKVISIEHFAEWQTRMVKLLEERGIKNVDFRLIEAMAREGKGTTYSPHSFTSLRDHIPNRSFENYVKSIDQCSDASLSLVVVDGRSRASCLVRARPKIARGGFLMLDNSDREDYAEAIALLADHARVDYRGIGPFSTSIWQTTTWAF